MKRSIFNQRTKSIIVLNGTYDLNPALVTSNYFEVTDSQGMSVDVDYVIYYPDQQKVKLCLADEANTKISHAVWSQSGEETDLYVMREQQAGFGLVNVTSVSMRESSDSENIHIVALVANGANHDIIGLPVQALLHQEEGTQVIATEYVDIKKEMWAQVDFHIENTFEADDIITIEICE